MESVKKTIMDSIMDKLRFVIRRILYFINTYWLLLFYFLFFCFNELVYTVRRIDGINSDFLFPVLFSISFSLLLFVITGLFPKRVNRFISICMASFFTLVYMVQLIYFQIFRVPLCIYSLVGAGDAMQFGNVIVSTLLKNIIPLLLLCIPVVLLCVLYAKKNSCPKLKPMSAGFFLGAFIITYLIRLLCINMTGDSPVSQRSLYYRMGSMDLAVGKLGLMPSVLLDIKQLIWEPDEEVYADHEDDGISATGNNETSITPSAINTPTPSPEKTEEVISPTPYNVMDIDFGGLIDKEKNSNVIAMHNYFSAVQPTQQNEYTGLFEGCNLIFITAEGFSSYAVDEKITPTLYKMANGGFVFTQFYNPIWGVSTSDGEYVACTGLIPKNGVWSFSRSSKNYLPFVMGNQFKKLGYLTKAYHNHTASYYDRNLSHPNLGYEFIALGRGLKIKETWPESDLEMMEVTLPQYIGQEPFHTYYMTISGHLQYNFGGNYIARKNKDFVKDLPYSDTSKAYLACQKELDLALEYMVNELEKGGILDKTVFVISSDHYPYGLPKQNIDELAGHKVEENFELYKSTLIIWKNGMKPVTVDKPCSSLDIIPTLSNLFGLEYDSRLLMGRDILSDSPPLVIFYNKSWITDRAFFNSRTNTVTFTDGSEYDAEYVKQVHQVVGDNFKFSAKILDTNYYRIIFNQSPQN